MRRRRIEGRPRWRNGSAAARQFGVGGRAVRGLTVRGGRADSMDAPGQRAAAGTDAASGGAPAMRLRRRRLCAICGQLRNCAAWCANGRRVCRTCYDARRYPRTPCPLCQRLKQLRCVVEGQRACTECWRRRNGKRAACARCGTVASLRRGLCPGITRGCCVLARRVFVRPVTPCARTTTTAVGAVVISVRRRVDSRGDSPRSSAICRLSIRSCGPFFIT